MGKFTAYTLPLKGMPIGIQEYEYHLGTEFFRDMESVDILGGDVTVKLTVNHRNDIYELNFVLDGHISIICDRCLDEMQHEVKTEYSIGVKYGDEYNDEDDDVLTISESDNTLNVAYMIYDTVALTIPLKHVHAPGHCNKAMSEELNKHAAYNIDDEDSEYGQYDDVDKVAGEGEEEKNVSIDPRWAALKKLKDNN